MAEGTHNGEFTEFYGSLKEIIELSYNSDLQVRRNVVLFRCDWYDQNGKRRASRNDGYFKSINIEGSWYKIDPFILATQSTKIFYLQDTLLGKNWQVVQKFEHRNLYSVVENDNTNNVDPYQEDNCSDNEHDVQDSTSHIGTSLRHDDDECIAVDASVVELKNTANRIQNENSDS